MAKKPTPAVTEVVDAPAVEAAVPLTLQEQLERAEARVAKLRADIAAEALRNDVQVDDAVTFYFGRGDKRRTLSGNVIGVKDDPSYGLQMRVSVGEGFDVEIYKVHVRDVVENTTKATRDSGADVATAFTADDNDPLNDA